MATSDSTQIFSLGKHRNHGDRYAIAWSVILRRLFQLEESIDLYKRK